MIFNHDQVAPNATILGYPLINIKDIGFPLPADANQKCLLLKSY